MSGKKECKHKSIWFSRCVEECEHGDMGMHDFCSDCGKCMDHINTEDVKTVIKVKRAKENVNRPFDRLKDCFVCRREIDGITVKLKKIITKSPDRAGEDAIYSPFVKWEKYCTDCCKLKD